MNTDKPPSLTQAARQIVANNKRGVLGTLLPEEGHPYTSMIDFAPLPDGDVIMFLSRLAVHQRHLAADARASLLIAPHIMADDALTRPRITLVGKVELVEDRLSVANLYLEHHPTARQYINFGDFQFYRLRVKKARYIAGFGQMGWMTGNQYRTAN